MESRAYQRDKSRKAIVKAAKARHVGVENAYGACNFNQVRVKPGNVLSGSEDHVLKFEHITISEGTICQDEEIFD